MNRATRGLLAALLALSAASGVHAESTYETAGDIGQILVPTSAYAATWYMHDAEGRKQFYRSFAANLGITYALKYTVDKQRPEGHGPHAFPSGHTAAAFQGAAFIHRRYGFKAALLPYATAAYVGWSRIEGESDKHDAVDVCAGAAIGILSSYFLTTPYENISVEPIAANNTYGLAVTVQW